MQSLQAWRNKRDTPKPAPGRLCRKPKRGVPRLAAQALRWLLEHRAGGSLGKGVRALLEAYTPPAATPKALSFKLRAIRRLWGSTLTVGIRLKW
jgi:hypothetical protein